MTIPQADRDFFKFNAVYFEQARMGFLHGMPQATLAHMEHMYRTHLDPRFVLTAWCSACVVDMMVRLSRLWESVQAADEAHALALQAAIPPAYVPEVISADLRPEPVATEVSARHVDKRPKSRRGRPKKQA